MKNFPLLFMVLAAQMNYGTLASLAESVAPAVSTTPAVKASSTSSTTSATGTTSAASSDEDIQSPKNFGHSSTLLSTSQIKIHCTAPHAACSESAEVLNIVQQIYKSLTERDYTAIGKYIDENCTKIDQATGKVIVGRKAILEDLQAQMDKVGPGSATPLISYTIDHPYAHVAGDNAVVTFTAFKEFGGDHPKKYQSNCTDIFKREGKSWMKISYRSNWKEVNL